jgi:peptidoglycan/xylan/chitin deacetylase (PgdA/CDA1 family)
MFHDVMDPDNTDFPGRNELKSFLTMKEFEYQIEHIINNYTIIRSDEVFNIDMESDEDYAILTFDDGLKDHYYVAKYLYSKGISATFLVPRSPIVDHKLIHTHKIQFIQSSVGEVKLSNEILDNFNGKLREELWETYSVTKWKDNWWSKEMIFNANFLRRYQSVDFNNYDYTNMLLKKYAISDEESFAKRFYLTTTHLENIVEMGHIIGGHGDSSENLLLLEKDIMSKDIESSINFIKVYTDKIVFSYPNGGFNEDIVDVLINKGCQLSFTIKPMTITNLDSVDYLEFPRYDGPQKLQLN